MSDQTANLLGAVGLAVSDRVLETARTILNHSGETPAALVVIGYGQGPSNDLLRRILGLSHPGTVRLVDRLVTDGLVERKKGPDNRTIALYLTREGHARREQLLAGRLAAIKSFLTRAKLNRKRSTDPSLQPAKCGFHMGAEFAS